MIEMRRVNAIVLATLDLETPHVVAKRAYDKR
jgi:hypothetical protein